MELRGHIETIIKNTFEVIDEVYNNNKESDEEKTKSKNGRLVFPNYRDKRTIRVSEQELRFIFVDQFINYCKEHSNEFDYYYSVEVPTEYVYNFPHKNTEAPSVNNKDKEGMQSASIDLAIYKNKKASTSPVAIIEFKKDGCSAHEIAKDFLKLSVEPGETVLRFFIMISSSDTRLEKLSKKEIPCGLLSSFLDKFNEDCFCFEDNKDLTWNEIYIRWHRLPSNGEKQRNGTLKPIDSNDFSAIYNFKGIKDYSDKKLKIKIEYANNYSSRN